LRREDVFQDIRDQMDGETSDDNAPTASARDTQSVSA
jgi:hypothetical protein